MARKAQNEFVIGQSSRSHATYRRPSLVRSTYGLVAELLNAAVEDSAVARRHRHVLGDVRLHEQRPLRSTSGHVT